jgi:hypothetical protein
MWHIILPHYEMSHICFVTTVSNVAYIFCDPIVRICHIFFATPLWNRICLHYMKYGIYLLCITLWNVICNVRAIMDVAYIFRLFMNMPYIFARPIMSIGMNICGAPLWMWHYIIATPFFWSMPYMFVTPLWNVVYNVAPHYECRIWSDLWECRMYVLWLLWNVVYIF